MSVAACAGIVERGDPDRFLATMAAPVAARAVLFPIYAFNIEVARAPWVSQEPLIGEMRLQWWRDILEEIGSGAPPRAHEVVAPLCEVARTCPLPLQPLDEVIGAHAALAEHRGLDDAARLDAFLEATGAGLMWAAAAALGADPALERPVRAFGWGAGLARYLRAIPALEERGLRPLPDGRPEAVQALARDGLDRLRGVRGVRIPGPVRPALLAGWRSSVTLSRAVAVPQRVADGALDESEFRRRASLILRAFTGAV
ncbi:MAG: squalene/phytoene synthase family protein [Pseudomonadota bacterium]